MNQSEFINELATALSKAQGEMQPAGLSGTNNHFKSDYMKLEDAWIACKKPLSDNGLSVVQMLNTDNDRHYLITLLSHSSGQWMRSNIEIPIQGLGHQEVGKCITYYKKFCLTAMVGIYGEEDDDGESLAGRPIKEKEKPLPPANMSDTLTTEELEQLAWRHKNNPEIIGTYLSKYGVEMAKDLPRSCYPQLIKDYTREFMKSKGEKR